MGGGRSQRLTSLAPRMNPISLAAVVVSGACTEFLAPTALLLL